MFREPFVAQTTPPPDIHSRDSNQAKESKEPCSNDEVYCLKTGQCSKDCNLESETCPPGEIYCLSLEMCSKDCSGNQKVIRKRQSESECPEGEALCLETGFCSADCIDNIENIVIADLRCPPGQTYCLQTESCSELCLDSGRDQNEEELIKISKRDSECQDGEY